MLHLTEPQIRNLIGPDEAFGAAREAFAALARNEVHQPPPIGLDLTDRRGEVHLKGAYVEGNPYFAFKVATGFYNNPERGLPTGSGLVMVFDAWTGVPAAILQDNGYLTEIRTGAAGALSCDLLARKDAAILGLVGAGSHARYQFQALSRVRAIEQVYIWSPVADEIPAFIRDVSEGIAGDPPEFIPAGTPDEVVSQADIAITVTPSRTPLISADALHTGLHLTCVGSDQPGKQELDHTAFRRIDRIFADHIDQAANQGELQHAIAAGLLERSDVTGTLGQVAVALKEGRTTEEEITFCDLTGVGVQDSAIASLTVELAIEQGIGNRLEG